MILRAKSVYKCSLVLASNQLVEVEALADRIAVFIRGGLHYIGTEEKLRTQCCKGIQLFVKMKPSNCSALTAVQKLRRAVGQLFPGIRALQIHKYFMKYQIRQSNTSVEADQKPLRWATVFERLEKLRHDFDLETYTFTIGNLEQIFYAYNKKYRMDDFN